MRKTIFWSNLLLAGFTSFCAAGSNVALAQELTFSRFQSMCSNSKNLLDYGFCIGFAEAIAGRVLKENGSCHLLRFYLEKGPVNFGFADVVKDLDPNEYPKDANEALEKFFSSKGCS